MQKPSKVKTCRSGRHQFTGIKCKECKKKYDKKHRQENKEKIAETKKEYDKKYIRSLRGKYKALKGSARRLEREFNISLSQYEELISSGMCHYLNIPISESGYSLDRKNSDEGYALDNVVPCSDVFNVMKGRFLNYEHALRMAKAILNEFSKEEIMSWNVRRKNDKLKASK